MFWKIVLLTLTVLLISVGQLTLKLGAAGLDKGGQCPGIVVAGVCVTWHLLLGIVIYGLATLVWIATLRIMPLSLAYPFVSLSYVVVAGLSVLFLGESVSFTYMLGLGLIVAGVSLIAFR